MQFIPKHGMSLVWGSLRNLLDFPNVMIPDEIRLVDTVPGYFPIDSHQPVPLELPRGGQRLDLSGRFNNMTPALWNDVFGNIPNRARIVQLPLYAYNSNVGYDEAKTKFSAMLRIWNETLIPESVPCAALAIRVRGGYCDERDAESVLVLLVWPNQTARTLELDWYEGPLEDCISPEWYIKSSLTLPLHVALSKTKNFVMALPNWSNLIMSLSPKPAFLGFRLQKGNRRKEVSGGWLCEWDYKCKTDFLEDTEKIMEDMKCLLMSTADQESMWKIEEVQIG